MAQKAKMLVQPKTLDLSIRTYGCGCVWRVIEHRASAVKICESHKDGNFCMGLLEVAIQSFYEKPDSYSSTTIQLTPTKL
ncbi:MAG: hypothetical protein MN733_26440 [Nitrososphaera sp.]|nr:hypothetical protein [Nitrososphaera sp.]